MKEEPSNHDLRIHFFVRSRTCERYRRRRTHTRNVQIVALPRAV